MSAPEELVLDIEGMTCASCVTKVEHALSSVPTVEEASVNLTTRTAVVRPAADVGTLTDAVRRAGYGAALHDHAAGPADREAREYRWRLVLAVALTVPVLALAFLVPEAAWSRTLAWTLATPVVFVAGWPFLRVAARAARYRTTTMDTLIALGASDGLRLQRVVVGVRSHGALLRHGRRDRDADPRRQGARGPGSRGGGGRRSHPPGAWREGSHRPGRWRGTDRSGGCGASGRPGGGATRGEDPRGRCREGGQVVGRPLPAHGRVRARRRRSRRRGRRGVDQRSRALGGLRHPDGDARPARGDRTTPGACPGFEGADPATGGPRLRGVRPRGARPRGVDARGLARDRGDDRYRAPARDRRRADRVPVRARARHARGDHGGRGAGRGARGARRRRGGVRTAPAAPTPS